MTTYNMLPPTAGPRHIRYESVLIRALSMSGAMPFESLQVADIGDVPIIPYNVRRSCDIITEYYRDIVKAGCTPLTMGGDHTLSYPILRAIKEKYGAVALIQVDAHLDLDLEMMGEPIAHGTPFRRALDENLIDPTKMFQIGLRGSMFVEEEIQEDFIEPQEMVYVWLSHTSCQLVLHVHVLTCPSMFTCLHTGH